MTNDTVSNVPKEEVEDGGDFGPIRPDVAAYNKFQAAEAKWLDSVVVGRYVPQWYTKWIMRKMKSRMRPVAGFIMWIVDEIYLARIIRIRITRNSDKTMLTGAKGYRKGIDHGMRLDRIHTRVLKGGKEIAKQTFPIGVIIK